MTFLNYHTHAASHGGIVETGGIGLGLLFPSWLLMATRDMALQWFSTIKHPWKIMTRHDNKISTLTIICMYQKMVQTSFIEIGGGGIWRHWPLQYLIPMKRQAMPFTYKQLYIYQIPLSNIGYLFRRSTSYTMHSFMEKLIQKLTRTGIWTYIPRA